MLSQYQQNFINEIQNPDGANVIVVDAKAGSGKTFTLCEGAKHMKGSTVFLAFNKAIAEELKTRGLNAMTIHSLGMKAYPKAKQLWQQHQELNLKYVACTRSEENLYWVENEEKKDESPSHSGVGYRI